MYLKALPILLPFLITTRVLAQQGTHTGVPVNATPDVTLPTDGGFVTCSAQDCSGTCTVTPTSAVKGGIGNIDPGFESIYWYNPYNETWPIYTCVNYYDCASQVLIGPDTCYNLFENGVPTPFTEWWTDV